MIKIEKKNNCCGCQACIQICHSKSIVLIEDNEGFLYPKVNKETCTNCKNCEKVCPSINLAAERKPLNVYAAKNKNDNTRLNSSSGGIFSLFAEEVLCEGGVVFGAKFNDKWEVVHDFIEVKNDLHFLQGSKYVQSYIGDSYNQAKTFLKRGRKVLFSGTPCQIAALKLFLKKEYENLFTIDIVCHGVPSPMVWKKYILDRIANLSEVKKINFRDKSISGWGNYYFSVRMKHEEMSILEPHFENAWMNGFLRNLYIRPSCTTCPSKCLSSKSDITIGDYWGIQDVLPKFNDDKGISLVLILTEKGRNFFSKIKVEFIETTFKDALNGNSIIVSSIKLNSKNKHFYKSLNNTHKAVKIINKYSRLSIKERIIAFLKGFADKCKKYYKKSS